MKHFKKQHPLILKKLQSGLANDKKSKFADLKKYIGTSYDFIGLSVPTQRKLFKSKPDFTHLGLSEQLTVWNEIWLHTQVYEVMTQALFFVEAHKTHFDSKTLFKTLATWVTKVDNWAHSDGLSGIYSYLLEQEPRDVYQQLKKWNVSENPWERRQSLVALLEYSKKRKHILPAPKLLNMIKPLLNDENYFVQKGIGWTLRETGNVYPAETWNFLVQHHAEISSHAFTAAIEKLAIPKKETLKKLRKKKRNVQK